MAQPDRCAARGALNAIALCRFAEAHFGIRVHPIAAEMPPEIHGAAVLVQGNLVIYFRHDTDAFFQEKVIFHELAHWYLGHLAAGREYRLSGYDSVEEREAEEWAGHLLLWAMGLERRGSGSAAAPDLVATGSWPESGG